MSYDQFGAKEGLEFNYRNRSCWTLKWGQFMCLALYLFTDTKLAESKWIKSDPKVFVVAVTEENDRDSKKWPHTQSRIYYIGGYQGCGCGWEAIGEWDEESDKISKTIDRETLAELLARISHWPSWLVVCWEGDQGKKLLPPKDISVDMVKNPEFEFEELRQYQICAGS